MARTARVGLALLALAATGLSFPATVGAAQGGNSAAAKACQKGGYVNYATTSGARFANAGACADYASAGGTLVALPDLVVTAQCARSADNLRCTVNVANQGAGAATGSIRLDGSVTVLTSGGLYSAGVDITASCTNGQASTGFVVDGIVGSASCDGPLAPGASLSLSFVIQGGGEASTVITIGAAADPANTVVESDESNNTFTETATF